MVRWIKSSKCDSASCVEVAFHEGEVIVRESDQPLRPSLYFKLAEWEGFIAGAKLGEFDLDRLMRAAE